MRLCKLGWEKRFDAIILVSDFESIPMHRFRGRAFSRLREVARVYVVIAIYKQFTEVYFLASTHTLR